MKIMHVVEGFGGGVYSFLVDICNAMDAQHEIILVYSKRSQTPENFENDFSETIKKINIQMKREIDIKSDFRALKKITKLIKNEKPDVVHLHSSKAGVLGRIAAKKGNVKKIFYNPHGYSFLQKDISKNKVKLYYLIEKFMGYIGGTTVAVSKGEYVEGKKINGNIVRIDNAIDTRSIKKGNIRSSKQRKITIGTMGRIAYQKNPVVFNEIATRFPEINFIWIGDGELRNELKSCNIDVTGWKKRCEAIEIMEAIDIYIQTSLWEGLPIALLEAMYMGKAVVVNDVVGNRDVIEQGKNGFIAKEIDEFEKYIKRLIQNESIFNELGNNAIRYIEEYHMLENMVDKYLKLYRG